MVGVRRMASILVGLVLFAHLTMFFSLFLHYPWGGHAVAFLVGAAVPIFWAVIATASLSVNRQPAALVVLGKCSVFTIYTLLAAAFVGALAMEGPWGWARFTSIAAVGLIAQGLWRNSKQIALKYGW